MDDEVVQIHIDAQLKKSVRIHWDTWALANEFYLELKERLIEAVAEHKLHSRLFIVVKHGEIFDLSEKKYIQILFDAEKERNIFILERFLYKMDRKKPI